MSLSRTDDRAPAPRITAAGIRAALGDARFAGRTVVAVLTGGSVASDG
ncbi:MAG: hypothetical protein ACRC35_03035 [Angustibacter sp.]